MHERLLIGAARAYATKGYHALTVEDILVAVGVSRPTFYKYFPDKHSIVRAIIQESNAALLAHIDFAVTHAQGALNKIEAAVDAYLDWGIAQGEIAARLYTEMAMKDSIAGQERQHTIQAITCLLHREVASLNLPSSLPQTDPLLLAAAVQGIELLGGTLFANPHSVARSRVRSHALTLLGAVLPMPEPLKQNAQNA